MVPSMSARLPCEAAERLRDNLHVPRELPQDLCESPRTFFRKLDAQYGEFVLTLLVARRDVLPESCKDLRQGALQVLFKETDEHGLPRDVKCYLGGVVRNLVRN